MKVWKSPVLYLGVLLVLAVAGALAAPFVLDWDGYKPRLEAYGEKLTGRKVEIAGPIAVRLFPWPRLIADQVKIANIAGSEEPHILAAERVVVKFTPAALLNGTIKVEEIDIEKPAFVLERTEAGEVNWRLSPSEDIGKSRLLEQVQLDRISIKEGSLRFIDRRNGIDSGFRQMNFALAAPGIDGPWRARGTATHKSRAYEIGVNTGQHRVQEAFRFGFRVAPGDGSGVIVSFDGDYNGADVTGTTRIEPAASQDGKGDAEGALRPLVFVSKVKAGFDRIAFETIEIIPRDTPNAATLVSGNAAIVLGEKRGVSAELSAPRLDFDDLAGATTWLKIRNGDFLSLASGLFESMPEGLEVAGKFKVGLLRAGGENIENALIELSGNRDGLAIPNLTASLPGRSRFLFRGDFAPGPVGADLKGILSIEANDLRQVSGWLWPEGKEAIAATWTGDRGRLKLEGEAKASARQLQLRNARYELDGVPGTVSLDAAYGERPRFVLDLDAGSLDFDAYVPKGLSAFGGGGEASFASVAAAIASAAQARDLRVNAKLAGVRLNGVDAKEVAADFTSGEKGLQIRQFGIGSVNGAKLALNGLILKTVEGADGRIDFTAAAAMPQGLLRLLGIIDGDVAPAWVRALGSTDLQGSIAMQPGSGGSTSTIEVSGASGELRYSGSATLSGLDGSTPITVSGTGALQSVRSGEILRLIVPDHAGPPGQAGRIVATVSGRLGENLASEIKADLYGATLQFSGKMKPAADAFGAEGSFAASAGNAGEVWAAAGVPATAPAGSLNLRGNVKPAKGGVEITEVTGTVADVPVSGHLMVSGTGRIEGQLIAARLVLKDILSAAMMPWGPAQPSLATTFAPTPPFALSGEFWLKPQQLELYPGAAIAEAEVGWRADPFGTTLNAFGKDKDGRNFSLEIVSKPKGAGRAIAGELDGSIDLSKSLIATDGNPVASGELDLSFNFEGVGRSPSAVMTALNGSGNFELVGAGIAGVSPSSFSRVLEAANDATGLQAAFDALLQPVSYDLGDAQGKMSIRNGVMTLDPVRTTGPHADARLAPVLELRDDGIAADIGLELLLKARPGLPAMELSYSGPPMALTRGTSMAELSSFLGYRILEKGVGELERLQAEQARLAAEEERTRKEDQAKYDAYVENRRELRALQRRIKMIEELRRQAEEKAKKDAEDAAKAEKDTLLRLLNTPEEILVPLPRTKPRPPVKPQQAAKPAPKPKPELQVPLVLVPPASP
ncbi:MAG: AsmA family protein [Aestuariivirga sp.]